VTVLSRGIARTSCHPGSNVDLLIERFLAPIYLHVLLPRPPVTGDFLDDLIDLFLNGTLQPARPRR
jgi:hypothetical protein